MKQPKKLTRTFKAIARSQGLCPSNYALVEEKEFKLILIDKRTGQIKSIDKKEIRR